MEKLRYLGVCDQAGQIRAAAKAQYRDTLAFLFAAKIQHTTHTQAVTVRCGKLKRRRAPPLPQSWDARIAAAALPGKVKAETNKLQEHVDVECTFLGVPKAMPPATTYGAMRPRGVLALSAPGKPILVILCAPLCDWEWYCLACEDKFKADALFLADLQCEVEHVHPDTIREAERLLEQVCIHHEAFCVAVAKAAVRAAEIRARKTLTARHCKRSDRLFRNRSIRVATSRRAAEPSSGVGAVGVGSIKRMAARAPGRTSG